MLQDGLPRIREVLDHRPLHRIEVATLDPFVQLTMECEFPRAPARNIMLDLPASRGEERDDARDPPLQRGVFRRLRDQEVEAGREPVNGPPVEEAILHLSQQPLHGLQVIRRGACGRKASDGDLHDLSSFKQVKKGILREERGRHVETEERLPVETLDLVAEASFGFGEAQDDQVLQRLSNRGAADAKLSHQRLFGWEPLTGPEPPVPDLRRQMVCDRLRQRCPAENWLP